MADEAQQTVWTACDVDGSAGPVLYRIRYHFPVSPDNPRTDLTICLKCLLERILKRHVGHGLTITRIR